MITNKNRPCLLSLLSGLMKGTEAIPSEMGWWEQSELLEEASRLSLMSAAVLSVMPMGVEVRCKDIVEVLPFKDMSPQRVSAELHKLMELGLVTRVEHLGNPITVKHDRGSWEVADPTRPRSWYNQKWVEKWEEEEIVPKVAFFIRHPYADPSAPIE